MDNVGVEVNALRIVRTSGSVSCNEGKISNWGCEVGSDGLAILIFDANEVQKWPTEDTEGFSWVCRDNDCDCLWWGDKYW